jgi:WD40 repeat protein
VDSVAFSPDGKLLASANGDRTVRLWQVATGKTIRDLPAGQTLATGSQAVAFSRDGSTLATVGQKVRLWKVATGEELAALRSAEEFYWCVAISPDGRLLAAGTYEVLHVWSMATRKEVRCVQEPAVSVAFSPDGRWLAFGRGFGRGQDGAGLVEIGKLAK